MSILSNLFVNTVKDEPVRINKPADKTGFYETYYNYIDCLFILMDGILEFIFKNKNYLIIGIGLIIFMVVMGYLTGLSMVESGVMYNHLQDVI